MVKKIIYYFLLINLTNNIISYKAILFEIDSILFDIDNKNWLILENLNDYYRIKLFDIISKIPIKDEYKKYISLEACYKNILYPEIWQLYLMGLIKSEDIINLVNNQIINSLNWFNPERHLLLKAASIAFNPKLEAEIMKPNNDIIIFIKKIKEQQPNIKLFLCSNKNLNSIEELKKRYKDIFNLFSKEIITSDNLKTLKPKSNFYNKTLFKLNLQKEDILLVESEKSYVSKARSLNIDATYYNKDDINYLNNLYNKIMYHNKIKL